MIPEPNVSNGASWILKAELEDGAVLGEVQIEKLLQSLDSLSSWTAILHICQSVDYLTLKFSQAKLMIRWAKSIETHERPFNRAWAIHVRVILAHNLMLWTMKQRAPFMLQTVIARLGESQSAATA